jgi:tetraacyldisaccharide 4'-kinase
MRAPGFWREDGVLPRLLAPLGRIYGAATAWRVARPGWHAPVPVICCGNATAGGSGKTTVALDLGARLLARGVTPAFLTRGYGGGGAVRRVDPGRDRVADVGDEALLLAACAATYAGADRAHTARMAVEWGAQVLVMDDGLQNPALAKTASLLIIDGAAGVGNGRVIPAGPLREPLAAAAARCRAAIVIGHDDHGLEGSLGIPVLRAELESPPEVAGRRLYAFAGIGRPGKFFASLAAAGAEIAGSAEFADHHRYSAGEFERVMRAAARLGADPVTTPKDAMRLTPAQRARVRVAGVRLVWQDAAAIEALLDDVMAARR